MLPAVGKSSASLRLYQASNVRCLLPASLPVGAEITFVQTAKWGSYGKVN